MSSVNYMGKNVTRVNYMGKMLHVSITRIFYVENFNLHILRRPPRKQSATFQKYTCWKCFTLYAYFFSIPQTKSCLCKPGKHCTPATQQTSHTYDTNNRKVQTSRSMVLPSPLLSWDHIYRGQHFTRE